MADEIYQDDSTVIDMSIINHIQKNEAGDISVITKNTRWNVEQGTWENNACVCSENAENFLKEYERYVSLKNHGVIDKWLMKKLWLCVMKTVKNVN